MQIIIKEMQLKNFKGVLGERKYTFAPDITEVYGANKTGKTTLADGFRWCLFGKNSEGAANFGIKTKDSEGKVIPQLEHEVQLLLEVDGREVTLRKVLQEKWGKPMGSKDKVLLGHTTLYFVDGNKYTEKDYKEYVATLCNEALFMCVTNPLYFTSLKADQQRALLTKMVGEVSNETLAEGNEDFAKLLLDMKGETLERYMEHIAYTKKEIKAELERIPVRINEQQQGVAELMAAGTDWKTLEAEVANLDAAMQRIDEEIADRSKVEDSKYEALAAERKAINQLKLEVQQLEYKHQQECSKAKAEYDAKYIELQGNIDKAMAELNACKSTEQSCNEYLQGYEERRQGVEHSWDGIVADFRTRWAAAEAESFAYDEDSTEFVCPTCKRRLDEEDVQAAIERMQANWNAEHAAKMEKLQKEAATLKENKQRTLDSMAKEFEQTQQRLEQAKAKVSELRNTYEQAEMALDKHCAIVQLTLEQRVADDTHLAQLKAEIEQRTAALEQPKQAQQVVDGTAGLKADKAQLQQKRDSIMLTLNNKQLIAGKQKRIEELEKQEQKLNAQLTELEGKEYTAQQLLEANITELEHKVNSLFTMVKFEMFDHKLNGSLKPTCECSVGGVPYSDLNNADRYNAGLDIINAICRYNNVYAPCFVDNAESINNVLPMQSQQVLMRVSNDKELLINPNL